MEKKDLDWASLPFSYMPTDYSYVCNYKDGEWGEGFLTSNHTITLSECAGIFHYCQEVFEGLKAYTTKDGKITTFRPYMNAERMADSAKRLCMPAFPRDRFEEAVKEVVKANAAWVPPYGTGATLYIRPFMIATGEVIGVKPATEYQFRILVTPVGPYFKGGDQSITITVADYDRAAPHGTGNIKAGLNYAMSLYPYELAHANGYSENLYLDSATRTYVEETGGANMILVDPEGNLVVPQSATDSILTSITRRSLVELAKRLGMNVIERPVKFQEILDGNFVECGLCGTAAVISPVARIQKGDDINVKFEGSYYGCGPVLKKLRETLTGIQAGEIEGPEGWISYIDVDQPYGCPKID
ncbi:MAG: branched-chain amino acid aminotransferase [Eggerthellales bacterium]|nr:branched-chain amino acid aminotransferase [Eggerthellales bacterium]